MHWFKISTNFEQNICCLNRSTLGEHTSIFCCICLKINFINSFIEFINSDDCIRKITSKSIRIYPVFI